MSVTAADPQTARILLLPGLGTDGRLFQSQRERFPRLESPEMLPPLPDESLPGYAQRMAASVVTTEPFYLGGASFGGAVALEMSRHVRPRAIFLISSCRHGESIAPHLRYFVRFADMFPARTFENENALSPAFVEKLGQLTPAQERCIHEMLADAQPHFVRWGIAAITHWEGAPNVTVPVHHIHGSDDQWIPLAGVQPDVVIPGGGHVLTVTHADEVNRFIADRIT